MAQATEPVGVDFSPHLSVRAQTLESGAFAFEPFPGANGHNALLLNSFSVGVTSFLQLGTVPLFYASASHRQNWNLKLNAYRSENLDIGFGLSSFSIRLTDRDSILERDGQRTMDPFVDLQFLFLALNWQPDLREISFGFNYAFPRVTSNSPLLEEILRGQTQSQREWNVEMEWRYSETRSVTFGLSELRLETFEIASPFLFGYGASWTFKRKGRWFPRISLGAHRYPSVGENRYLFSFDF